MMVVYVISTLEIGGAEMMLVNLINALPQSVKPVVVTLRDRCALAYRIENPRTDIRCVYLRGRLDPRPWARLASILRAERPDVIHSHMLLSNLGARLTGPFVGVKAIINHEHGISRWKGPVLRLLDRLSQSLVSRVVVVSEASRQERIRKTGISAGRIVVIPNAIDVGSFQCVTSPKSEGFPTWGTIARLDPIKRVDRVLKVVSAAHKIGNTVRLLVAGDGPERVRLEQTARRLGISGSVDFVGAIDDLVGFYSRIDLLLLTSALEDCPMTVIEALASGRFVAAPAVGGVPELLKDAPDALLFSPEERPEVIAARLAGIGPGFESKANRKCAMASDVSRYVETTLDLYDSVCAA